MTCGEECGGGFPVRALLTTAAETGRWTRASFPLNCFAQAGVDMSGVDAPLMLVTDGQLDLTLASARIVSPTGGQLSCK